MRTTIIDNMGVPYSSVHGFPDVFVSYRGYVITGHPRKLHIPMEAPNGELYVAHGVEGLPMEVAKLVLLYELECPISEVTGYDYRDPDKGLTPNNIKIVPAEDTKLNVLKDVLLNPEIKLNTFLRRGEVSASGTSLRQILAYTTLELETVAAAIYAGGGYARIDDTLLSINPYFKVDTPFLTREAIVRLGAATIFNGETNKREFSATPLSALWYGATDQRKSNDYVYDLLKVHGSTLPDGICVKFVLDGKVHEVTPARRSPKLF